MSNSDSKEVRILTVKFYEPSEGQGYVFLCTLDIGMGHEAINELAKCLPENATCIKFYIADYENDAPPILTWKVFGLMYEKIGDLTTIEYLVN